MIQAMKTIWKWTLNQLEEMIDMPDGAKILTVQEQYGKPQIWALVDPDARRSGRTFHVYGTGHNLLDDPGRYVGTVQACGERAVWHVFEK